MLTDAKHLLCRICLQVVHLSGGDTLSECIGIICPDVAHGALPGVVGGKLNTCRISWEQHSKNSKSHICPGLISGEKGSNPDKCN